MLSVATTGLVTPKRESDGSTAQSLLSFELPLHQSQQSQQSSQQQQQRSVLPSTPAATQSSGRSHASALEDLLSESEPERSQRVQPTSQSTAAGTPAKIGAPPPSSVTATGKRGREALSDAFSPPPMPFADSSDDADRSEPAQRCSGSGSGSVVPRPDSASSAAAVSSELRRRERTPSAAAASVASQPQRPATAESALAVVGGSKISNGKAQVPPLRARRHNAAGECCDWASEQQHACGLRGPARPGHGAPVPVFKTVGLQFGLSRLRRPGRFRSNCNRTPAASSIPEYGFVFFLRNIVA